MEKTWISHNSLSALGAFLPTEASDDAFSHVVESHNSLSALGAFLPTNHGSLFSFVFTRTVTIAFRR